MFVSVAPVLQRVCLFRLMHASATSSAIWTAEERAVMPLYGVINCKVFYEAVCGMGCGPEASELALLSTSGPEALRASPCNLLVLPVRAEVKEPCRPALVVALVAACVTVRFISVSVERCAAACLLVCDELHAVQVAGRARQTSCRTHGTGQLPLLQDVESAVRGMPWCLSLVCRVQQQQRSCC